MKISSATGLLAWIAITLLRPLVVDSQFTVDFDGNSTKEEDSVWTSMPTEMVTQGFEAVTDLQIGDNLTEEGLEAATCHSNRRPFVFKEESDRVFRVGVHSIRGFEVDRQEYTTLFSEYLTKTAGRRFDPPIEFEMIPMTFEDIMNTANRENLDFVFANPSIYSCLGIEIGASALATVISSITVRERHYELDVYAGVMFALYEREDIQTVDDFKDKIIGRSALGDLAGGQLQFYEMVRAGMSYTLEPKQIVIAQNQDQVLEGVLDGSLDVGFVRTDQIEGYTTEDGEQLDPSLFRVIQPLVHILDDGDLFPFLHSTEVFPEWPLAALKHVPIDVAEEVQDALLALKTHAEAAEALEACPDQYGMTQELCDLKTFPDEFSADARCDTTKDVAWTALNATRQSHKGAFRPPRSYFDVRTVQEAAEIINQNDKGDWVCRRSSNLYEGVGCPEGYLKVSEQDFNTGCEKEGLSCKEGRQCFCRPCTYQVFVHQQHNGDEEVNRCDKGEVCGVAQQRETITLRATDNMKREFVKVRAVLAIGGTFDELPVTRVNGTFLYDFEIKHGKVEDGSLEIYFDDEPIVQSPMQIRIRPLDCSAKYPGQERSADDNGKCVCGSDAIEIGDKCVVTVVLFSCVASVVILGILIAVYFYAQHKRRISDQVWVVNPEDLHFGEPPEIIGQGSFGVVVLGEYRGTKVAIKSVLPNKTRPVGGTRTGSAGLSSGDSKTTGTKEYLAGTRRPSEFVHPNDDTNSDVFLTGGSSKEFSVDDDSMLSFPMDSGADRDPEQGVKSGGIKSGAVSSVNLKTLTKMSFGVKKSIWARLFPGFVHDENAKMKADILGSISGGTSTNRPLPYVLCPCFDKQYQEKESFMLEMRLLSKLRHPCITTVMGAVMSKFHDPMLVMEYMEYGSLHDLLQNETIYTGGDVLLQILRDIAQGLRYLHSSRPPICHGDLKARNILIDSRFRAKVADFGLSTKKKNSLTGTPFFMAPEYLRGASRYTPACDMYSVGMLLYEIYSRSDPYTGEDVMDVLKKVCDPRIKKRPHVPECMPPKVSDIMRKCWSADPTYRPQAKDLDMTLMDMAMQDAEPLTREMINNGGKEKPKTRDMLYEVFPRHIADALKAGRKVDSETHDCVTVFFSDIVGFTNISRQMSSLKVCEMLERLYEEFDKLARAYKVFKVETIGDAYMGVTNLEGNQDKDHVRVIAEFALAAIEAAGKVLVDEEDPSTGYIRIRVGFHSGPVVSNVIGSLNPRYGLFGDTVNTASRMESNSIEGRILCSEDSAKLLMKQAPKLLVRKRGKVEVKGKGDMMTYWVLKSKKHKPNHSLRDVTASETAKDLGGDSTHRHDDSPMEEAQQIKNTGITPAPESAQEQAPVVPKQPVIEAHEKLIEESANFVPPMDESARDGVFDV